MKKWLLCGIIFGLIMTAPTWGLLAKSQDDNETIEQAIVRIVTEHDADPDAHLVEGGSLDLHRTNDTLDHPSSSVVADKFSSDNRFLLIPTSNDVDVFFDNDTASYLGFLVRMDKNSPSTGDAFANLLNFQMADLGYIAGDIVVDFLFSADNGSGTAHAEFNINFAKVYLDNGHYKLGYYDGSWHYTSLVAFSQNIAQRWRIHYSAVDNAIEFYLNGALIYSVVQTPVFETSDYMISVLLNRGTTTFASVFFGGISIGFPTS